MHFLSPEDTFQYMPSLPEGDIFEFGTYTGNYLRRLVRGAIEQNCGFKNVRGFDSWVGLPREQDNIWNNPDWPEFAFSLSKDYNLKSTEDCIKFVCKRIDEFLGDLPKPPLYFYSGWFNETLTKKLGKELENKCSYCHIDCDLYISTKDVMEWLFTHNILIPGALVRYDDWGSTPLYTAGNSKSWLESTNKYRILWTPLGNNTFIYEKHNI